MEVNPETCELMHFGKSNSGRRHKVNGSALRNVEEQGDRRDKFRCFLQVALKVERVVKKTFDMLAFISHNIEYKS